MTAKYMSVKYLAERWGYTTPRSIYSLIESGQLPAMRLGTAIRIPISAVEAYEKANTTGTTEP